MNRDWQGVRQAGPSRAASGLTEQEATVLALVQRAGPLTGHQVRRAFERSPVTNFGTGQGSIYPIIHRLKAAGLVAAEPLNGRARGAEQLRCTPEGASAVREWVLMLREADLLLEDPVRTRTLSFELLTRDEQIQWLSSLHDALKAKLQQLDDIAEAEDMPYKAFVLENARLTIEARRKWAAKGLKVLQANQPLALAADD